MAVDSQASGGYLEVYYPTLFTQKGLECASMPDAMVGTNIWQGPRAAELSEPVEDVVQKKACFDAKFYHPIKTPYIPKHNQKCVGILKEDFVYLKLPPPASVLVPPPEHRQNSCDSKRAFNPIPAMQQIGLSSGRPFPLTGRLSRRKLPLRLGGMKQRVSAVLVPADIATQLRGKNKDSRSHQPGQSRGLAGVLLSAMRVWERQEQQKISTEELLAQAAVRGDQISKLDAKNSGKKTAPPPPAIEPFLRPVGIMELRYIRMLSNMSSLTYFMSKLVSPESLNRRHGLRLVTSSLSCEATRRLPLMSPLQAMVDGDATAADVSRIISSTTQESVVSIGSESTSEAAAKSPAMKAISRIEPLAMHHKSTAPAVPTDVEGAAHPATSPSPSPTEIVANSLSAAAAAAAAAAGSVYSAAAPIAAPIANNISTFASSATSPLASVASQLQNAAAAGQAGTYATLATVSAAVMSGKISPTTGSPSVTQQCVSPTEWYVADDEEKHMRYFVIQGSDNMDHWKVNLTFDPVAFEDSSLGVKVHRGVYETAMILYDRFLPLVQDHVASSPSARIAFTGHSLGGSLATLLMMMYLKRGVVSAENLAPVYTFGAPAIFCEGAAGACGLDGDCSIPSSSNSPSTGGAGGSHEGLLKKLGLPSTAVRNVVMHKDIVPRAFACDYSLVADLLKRVGESFREHKCLNGNGRRVMFNFVGKMIVLQPDVQSSFVSAGEGYHSMLPQKPGMFVLREPTVVETMHAQMQRETEMVSDAITNLPATASSAMDVPPTIRKIHTTGIAATSASTNGTLETTATASTAVEPRHVASSSDEALWQLMNFPHPLDILADPGAYGDQGSISRYHNPDNYTKAIGGVLRARGVAYKNVVERAKRSGVTFTPPSLGAKDRAAAATVVPEAPPSVRSSGAGGGKMQSPLAIHRSPSFSS
ncbi:hypothetical protein Ndes2526B_g04631 [Nannochloris sp. 'desiccata']